MKRQRIAQVALASLMMQGCMPSSPEVEQIGYSDLKSQRISGEQVVRVAGVPYASNVSVRVVVDVDGRVVNAEVDELRHMPILRALLAKGAVLAAAREWKFKPPTFEGRPVNAVGRIDVPILPEELPADTSVAFPSAPPSDVTITLTRSFCLGSCPDYRVTITGDGKVQFSTTDIERILGRKPRLEYGYGFVLLPGDHEARVDPAAVAALLEKFKAAHFMGLQDDYSADVTDMPSYTLSLDVGNVTKGVDDYAGRWVGMPSSVKELQDAVDAVAGTDRWVHGNAGTVALLKHQGFDFRSKQAAELVLAATRLGVDPWNRAGVGEFTLAAINEGLDLSQQVHADVAAGSTSLMPIGVVALLYAAKTGNDALFEALSRRGQFAKAGAAELTSVFHGGAGCSPRIAKALAAAGAAVNAGGERRSALHELSNYYSPCSGLASGRRAEMAQTLIDLGVPPDARDQEGRTPLMESKDPMFAQVLLKAGADPNARAADGQPALMSVWDDRVALLLLRAGADPRVKYQGETLRQKAREWRWPGTLAWLDAHNVP